MLDILGEFGALGVGIGPASRRIGRGLGGTQRRDGRREEEGGREGEGRRGGEREGEKGRRRGRRRWGGEGHEVVRSSLRWAGYETRW